MTRRLYYEDQYMKNFNAQVVSVERRGDVFAVVLDATAFYPGGGGQPHDTGVLESSEWRMKVNSVVEEGGRIVHLGSVEGREPSIGDQVQGVIDWNRRYRLMRMHTAAHIIGYAVKKLFGLSVRFASSALGLEQSHLDFTASIKRDDLPRLAEVVREVIEKDLSVKVFWLSRDEAEEYLKRFGEELTELHEGIETVRIVEIEELYGVPCGGTHVARTGEVGTVLLLKRESKGRGITRIRYTLEG